MQTSSANYSEAKLQALKFGWESYLDEAGNSEDNELKAWIVKAWRKLRKAGLAPAEEDLPEWLQVRIRSGREQATADEARAEYKKSPAGQVEQEREKRAAWEKARAKYMRETFGEPGYPKIPSRHRAKPEGHKLFLHVQGSEAAACQARLRRRTTEGRDEVNSADEDRPEEEWLKDLEEAEYLEQTARYLLEDAANLRKGVYEYLKKKQLEQEAVNPEFTEYLRKTFEEVTKEEGI